MTIDRFAWQHHCGEAVAGQILNVGCKEDPSGFKATWPERTVNLDVRTWDDGIYQNTGEMRPIPVDVVWDCTKTPWPFEDDEFGLVVLGDILEDLPNNECQLDVLREARRVASHVCITTPQDTPERDWHHFTTITEQRLRDWLTKAGWKPDEFKVVRYDYDLEGYFVLASRT